MTMHDPRWSYRTTLAAIAARLASPTRRLATWIGGQVPVHAAAAAWSRLLDEACDLIAPVFARFGKAPRLVVLPRDGGGLKFVLVEGGVATPLDAAPAEAVRRSNVELRLRTDQVLERRLTLPAASRDYLDAIIEHRLERLAPWRREAILHGYTVESGGAGDTLALRLLLTSTDIVSGPLSELGTLGLVPAQIGGAADQPAEPLRITLGRADAARRPAWQRTFERSWLVATATLCFLGVAATLMAVGAEARRVEAERQLVKARRLIREATDTVSRDTVPLLSEKRPDRATMVLIDTLAATLPVSSYLRELTVTPDEVRLSGTSADAPALVPLIERAGFHNVRFTGPVSRGEDRRDTFEITADRVPGKPLP